MNNILKKFKFVSKLVEIYQKNSLNSDKREKNIKKEFKNDISAFTKTSLENRIYSNFDKILKFSRGTSQKYLMKLKNSNIKNNLSRNFDFAFSSNFRRKLSQQYSRNISSNIRSFRMSFPNNTKNNSAIDARLSNSDIKINLKYSSFYGLRLRNKRNNSNNNSDSLINIKTKLNNENTHRFNINHTKYQIKSSLSNNDISFE